MPMYLMEYLQILNTFYLFFLQLKQKHVFYKGSADIVHITLEKVYLDN